MNNTPNTPFIKDLNEDPDTRDAVIALKVAYFDKIYENYPNEIIPIKKHLTDFTCDLLKYMFSLKQKKDIQIAEAMGLSEEKPVLAEGRKKATVKSDIELIRNHLQEYWKLSKEVYGTDNIDFLHERARDAFEALAIFLDRLEPYEK